MMAVRAAAAFLRSYLLRAGLLDGSAGVVVAVAAAANADTGLALAAEAPRADRSRAGEVLPPRR